MATSQASGVLAANQALLDAIGAGDWKVYAELVDQTITCFEPESKGHLAHGHAFHQFYFDKPAFSKATYEYRTVNSMSAPQVRMLGDTAAVVAYTRLVQRVDAATGASVVDSYEETRVWQLFDGQWRNVHFHKSAQGK